MVRPCCAQRVLEHLQRYAALHGGLHVLGVDLEDPVHPRAVDHERVLDDRLEAALGAGAAGAGDDVEPLALRRTSSSRATCSVEVG